MNILLFIYENKKNYQRISELLNIISSWNREKKGKIFILTSEDINYEIIEEMKYWNIEKIYLIKNEKSYFGQDVSRIAKRIILQENIDIVAMGNSIFERELAPYLSSVINYEFIPNIVKWEFENDSVHWERFLYGTRAIETIDTQVTKLVVTLSTNIYKKDEKNEIKYSAEVEKILSKNSSKIENSYKIISQNNKILQKNPLETAKLVIGIGKGIRSKENFKIPEKLAEILGATIGVTRSVVDNGWRPEYEKIGQTGKIIKPELYLGFGISGAMQHMAGISQSRHIIMVNSNPNAESFRGSDLGIVGDLFEVIPNLIKKLSEK